MGPEAFFPPRAVFLTRSAALAAVQQLEARHAAKEAAWQQERGELERRANEADKLRQTLAAAARQALADEARWQDEREEMQATIDDLREALEAQRSASTTPRKTSLAASAVQPIATRARTATEDNERDMQQRISVIEELLKTERDYVDGARPGVWSDDGALTRLSCRCALA